MRGVYLRGIIMRNKQFITDGYSVWLYSPRRYGKSSLIHKVFNELTNIKLIYFDLYNVFSTDNFCRKYSKLLAKEKLQPICIAFDEFQEIERIDPFMINWMRSVFQTQENVSYIFLGSKQSLMRNIFSSVNSPFYEFAVKMDIKPISYNDLFEFIKSKFGQQKMPILDKNIDDILQVSECHPHFTQYFASVVFDMIRSGENQDVDNFKNMWLNKIIDSQSVIFQHIFDQLKNNQRRILSLIAIPDDRAELFSEETRNKYQLPASSSINTILKALMKKDLIHKADNLYKVDNPVFKAWLRQISK